MGLAVGVEEGQAVETLIMLREAAKAQEESADTHLHQHPSLLAAVRRQRRGHLHHLSGGLRLPLPFAGQGLRSGLLRGGRLWRGGWDRQRVRTRVRRDLGGGTLRERHHHRFYNFLDDLLLRLDGGVFTVWCWSIRSHRRLRQRCDCEPTEYRRHNTWPTCVLGRRHAVLHWSRAFRGGRAGFPRGGFVAAVLRAGGISEGILGGVGVGEHHHLTVLTALCQNKEKHHVSRRRCHRPTTRYMVVHGGTEAFQHVRSQLTTF